MFLLSLTHSVYISYACSGINIFLKEGVGNSGGHLSILLIFFRNSHQMGMCVPRHWPAVTHIRQLGSVLLPACPLLNDHDSQGDEHPLSPVESVLHDVRALRQVLYGS